MNRRKYLAVLATIPIAGCTAADNTTGETTSTPPLKILDHNGVVEDAGYGTRVSVEGTAENTTTDTFAYAAVEAKFYDSNETVLESSLDNISGLGPGERWNFEIRFPGLEDADEAESYRVSVSTVRRE